MDLAGLAWFSASGFRSADRKGKGMNIFGIVGWSGSGKTELVIRLIPELIARGFSVSSMKHTHHGFDIDRPGKDSYRHREAGAKEVMVTSSVRWALLHELQGDPEHDMEDLIARMAPVDILLIEGFKSHKHPKLEVFRADVGKSLLAREDDTVIAVASDAASLDGISVPLFDLDDIKAIADFVQDYLKL